MDDQPRISKKAEKRLAKKAEKEEGRRARVVLLPTANAQPRIGAASPLAQGSPRYVESPGYLDQLMQYAFQRWDADGEWSWGLSRARIVDEWAHVIEPALSNHTRETWRHICSLMVHGENRSLRRNHAQDVSSLVREAQVRWEQLSLHEHPTAFRFRLGATRRLWGYREENVFHVVWWDPHHEIYPVG